MDNINYYSPSANLVAQPFSKMVSANEYVEEPQAGALERQMAYNPDMDARAYFARLREFNIFYGYQHRNNNLPEPDDVPENITIEQYDAQQQQ